MNFPSLLVSETDDAEGAPPVESAPSTVHSWINADFVPSWLRPFTLDENTRFTRTPDHLLRPPEAPAAAPGYAVGGAGWHFEMPIDLDDVPEAAAPAGIQADLDAIESAFSFLPVVASGKAGLMETAGIGAAGAEPGDFAAGFAPFAPAEDAGAPLNGVEAAAPEVQGAPMDDAPMPFTVAPAVPAEVPTGGEAGSAAPMPAIPAEVLTAMPMLGPADFGAIDWSAPAPMVSDEDMYPIPAGVLAADDSWQVEEAAGDAAATTFQAPEAGEAAAFPTALMSPDPAASFVMPDDCAAQDFAPGDLGPQVSVPEQVLPAALPGEVPAADGAPLWEPAGAAIFHAASDWDDLPKPQFVSGPEAAEAAAEVPAPSAIAETIGETRAVANDGAVAQSPAAAEAASQGMEEAFDTVAEMVAALDAVEAAAVEEDVVERGAFEATIAEEDVVEGRGADEFPVAEAEPQAPPVEDPLLPHIASLTQLIVVGGRAMPQAPRHGQDLVPSVMPQPAARAPAGISAHFQWQTYHQSIFTIGFAPPEAADAAEPPAGAAHQEALPGPALPPAAAAVADEVEAPVSGYELPPLDLLREPPQLEPDYELSEEFLDQSSAMLQQVLRDFGVRGEVIDANPGPVVTLYEFEPAPGVKSSRVIGLSADIARSMSAISARVAVVEGRNVIGIELPNRRRDTVWLRELLASQEFVEARTKLGLCLGKTIGGVPVITDLARMPHLLVAGTTGSGKSVAINTMILSLLYRHTPEACRLIMIDPKMLELSVYEGIPHLLTPVVTDPKKAIIALKWAVKEMEDRYRKMSRLAVRNIDGYNTRMAEARERAEVITRQVQVGFDRESGEALFEEQEMDLSALPYIVVIVDEMADLMMVAGKEIEGAIQRLAQMARAAGIHLVMATQRPSVDVITGTIKANFPTRISFQVTSKIDSRTILGEMGAETLLGQGDMLFMAGGGRITRVHGPFVSDGEVEKVVAFLKAQGGPEYLDEVVLDEEAEGPAGPDDAVFDKGELGETTGDLYDQAVAIVLRDRKASTSYIQRRLQVGYNKAASLMERMETEGIVGPANHAGKREILSFSRPE